MKLKNRLLGYVLLLLIPIFPQLNSTSNVYLQFSELRGMEDASGNTQLFYRIYSYQTGVDFYNTSRDIYRMDVAKKRDTIFLANSGYYNFHEMMDFGWLVNAYQFWKNDYSKYIYSWVVYGSDLGGDISRFDSRSCRNYAGGYPQKIFISNQNDSLLYDDVCGKSTDGGWNWFADTLIKGIIVGLSPVNDSVLFFRDYNHFLCKTLNGGFTSHIVDTSKSWNGPFIFSDDGEHVFTVDHIGSGAYRLRISSIAGELGSWSTLYSSDNQIFISLDDTNKKLYAASGKNIMVYDYAGNLTSENYYAKKTITGLYKKPGTDKLYIETLYEINEVTPDTVKLLKRLPVGLDLNLWYPLAIGNKWIYDHSDNLASSYKIIVSVIGDTLMPNGLKYFKVKREGSTEISFSYQRYDTLSGKIRAYQYSYESILYKTYLDVGDTLWTEYSVPLILESEGNSTSYGYTSSERSFSSLYVFGNDIHYKMKKGLGVIEHKTMAELCGGDSDKLLACTINGKVYGDTTLLGVQSDKTVLPTDYALYQNYPNPFNPSTRIAYTLPIAGNIKLNIHSITGALVATVVNEYQTAGIHSVEFNAKGLASGIYVYKLNAGSFVQNKKMIVLK